MKHKTTATTDRGAGEKEIKCVVWDLDNTLWDGVLLEKSDVTLKKDIRAIIQALDERGIMQSIASKNNYQDGMDKLKEFGIDRYFIYPAINWNAKSASIYNLHLRLNIGLDTFLFVDDQDFERDEVKSALPDVAIFDSREYHRMLELPCLNPSIITSDSKKRREMYLVDVKRKEEEQAFTGNPLEFLATLNLEMSIRQPTHADDFRRMEELLLRTNRLNASKIAFTYQELQKISDTAEHRLLTFELSDKYGSYGQAGAALIRLEKRRWHLFQFAVSCRVISRNAADTFLLYILHEAGKNSCDLTADYVKSGQNTQLYTIYRQAGLIEDRLLSPQHLLFRHDCVRIKELPGYIIIRQETNG